MLKDLRKGLANTIEVVLGGQARVLPYPPHTLDMPRTGPHLHVEPAPTYVQPFMTFSVSARAQVDLHVVVHVPADSAEEAADWCDDLIDPMSDGINVFRAVTDDPTLGISDFQVAATPMLDAVEAPEPVLEADGGVRVYRFVVPVQIIVQRS